MTPEAFFKHLCTLVSEHEAKRMTKVKFPDWEKPLPGRRDYLVERDIKRPSEHFELIGGRQETALEERMPSFAAISKADRDHLNEMAASADRLARRIIEVHPKIVAHLMRNRAA